MSEADDASAPISDRMQSLLAQAAEDQLTEQRQLAEALVEVRTQLTSITSDVAALRNDVENDLRIDSAVGAVSAEVREAVRLIGERLDGLARMVHQRGLDIAELRGSFGELRTSVVAHSEALSGLTGGMDQLPSYGDRVAALQETVGALGERLSGLDDVRTAVADVDGRVGATADSVGELRRSVDEINARLGSLAAAGDLEATGQQVASLHERLEGLNATSAPLIDGLSSVQESLRLETERNARFGEQMDELRNRIDSVASGTSALQTDNEELNRRLDGMAEDITAIGGNVAGLVESAVDPADLTEAIEAASTASEQVGRINEIAVQVADVRAALVGESGLEAQVSALSEQIAAGPSPEELDQRIESALSAAVAASEQRLNAHLDEAVLALAEVLLKRRPGRVGSAFARGSVEPAAVAPPVAASEPIVANEMDEPVHSGDEGFVAPAVGDIEVIEPAFTDEVVAPWDVPDTGPTAAEDDAPAEFVAETEPVDELHSDSEPDSGDTESLAAESPAAESQAAESPAAESQAAESPTAESDSVHHTDAGDDDESGAADADGVETSDEDGVGGWQLAQELSALAEDEPSEAGSDAGADGSLAPSEPEHDWSATVTTEVTVEEAKRKRRPWWRPGD